MTTIHYEGSDDRPGWTTNLFSSEDRPTVRMYSWIDLDTDEFDYLRVLETVNAANYTYLLDTVIDLTVDTHRLRVRDVHRPSGATVDENEFADSLGHHLAQVTLWSFVLQRVLRGAAPVTEMFDEAIDAATSIFESEDTPAEKGHDEQSS
ncbi:hypothetical protein G5S35_08100 [Paraburkholderia tropica]|uniref:hypothetical protein n=1 Tax=Paraburkholderia tropica TaxID=92647 RepID=UPI0015FF241C|nr:hypothetical protein [Paraburkholderia tropica]QNB11544.1 hypothetical protein G5S35_08100 [Paraburkholderia tropica]